MSVFRNCGTCVCCGVCCLFAFWGVIYTIIFFSIFHPHGVSFSITDASVTMFNFTSNTTLYYSFGLNITVRNPNNRIGVDYRRVTAIAYYKDSSFGAVNLSPFSQGHKNTSYIHAWFQGQQGLWLKEKYLNEYYSETNARAYLINVDLDLEIRARYGRMKVRMSPPIISCRLKIPVVDSDGRQPSSFSFSKCKNTGKFFSDRYSTGD